MQPAPIPKTNGTQQSDAFLALLAAVLVTAARDQGEKKPDASNAMVTPPARGLTR
jgi:hypothetical protein